MIRLGNVIASLRYSLRCKPARLGMAAVLAGSLACLATLLGWWVPALRAHGQLASGIASSRAAIVQAARAEEVAGAHRDAVASLALFEKKLSTRSRQADLVQVIARLASQRGVHVVSQAFDEGRDRRPDALYVDLGVAGKYDSLRGLLGDFAALPMWLEVVEARMERSGGSGDEVQAQLRLMTYRADKAQAVRSEPR